jgi:hypothetical protein
MKRTVLALALLLMSGCTLGGGLAGAGITKLHNSNVEPEQRWSYVLPVVTGAAIGLVLDVLIVRALGKGLGTYTKQ